MGVVELGGKGKSPTCKKLTSVRFVSRLVITALAVSGVVEHWVVGGFAGVPSIVVTTQFEKDQKIIPQFSERMMHTTYGSLCPP